MVLKQNKLDEALRAGAASRRVNVDRLMASTIHTLVNYNIEFTPASNSQNALEDEDLKYILLKPENEPLRKQYEISMGKRNAAKFEVPDFPEYNNKKKGSMKYGKTVGKGSCSNIEKYRRKKKRKKQQIKVCSDTVKKNVLTPVA